MSGEVTITSDDIYDILVEVRDDVRDLKAKDRTDDHEARIRLLERSAWKVAGAVMIMGAFGGLGLDRLFGGG